MTTTHDVLPKDKDGNVLSVGDTVDMGGPFGSSCHRVTEISEKVNRVGEQFGGWEFRSVKISGFGWVNPVAQLRKVA